jgi:hypothetical protein
LIFWRRVRDRIVSTASFETVSIESSSYARRLQLLLNYVESRS